MHKPKPRPATYADIEALPEHLVGEIIFGVLHTHPRPAPRHSRATSRLGIEIGGPFDRGRGGPGGWIILDEPELHLGPHVIVPDIAGWRRERMPRLPETAWFETPPDWVCEVLSPSTARIDRTDKLAVYAAFNVSHAWYVDPVAKTLEVFALVSAGAALSGYSGASADVAPAPEATGAGAIMLGSSGASADVASAPEATGAGAWSAPEAPIRRWRLDATFKDDEAVSAPPFEVHTFPLDVLWPEEG